MPRTISRITLRLLVVAAGLVVTCEAGLAQGAMMVKDVSGSRTMLFVPPTLDLIAGLPIGQDVRDIVVSPDRRYAYIARHGGTRRVNGQTGSTVLVVDLRSRSLASVFDLGEFSPTHGMRLNSTGSRLWVTAAEDGSVLELDTRTGDFLMIWKTGQGTSHNAAVTPDDRQLYVANINSDVVTVIDRARVAAFPIRTGRAPSDIEISPNGREAWVANSGANTISVINVRNNRKVADVPAGTWGPVRVQFTPEGEEVWALHRNSRVVSVYNVLSRERVATITLSAVPSDILFSADGARAFVTIPAGVVEIDTASREIERTIDSIRRTRGTARHSY